MFHGLLAVLARPLVALGLALVHAAVERLAAGGGAEEGRAAAAELARGAAGAGAEVGGNGIVDV